MPSPDLSSFRGLALPGDFVLTGVALVPASMLDPIGRAALAKTTIHGHHLDISLDARQSAEDQSISIYHELLEGLTVALPAPPPEVVEFNEGDFEREAQHAHFRFGVATPATVLEFLARFGFR